MPAHFTSNHFELLKKWRGQKRDSSNSDQNRAYKELKEAYEATETWANLLKARLFPESRPVDIRKRPTSQGNNFSSYNWAKIYPSADAPKELAYTIGIGADDGFVVKIDTVGLDDMDPVRKAYLSLRGDYNNTSPIVAILPAADGLGKTLDELVAWSEEAIRSFALQYDEVAERLGLHKTKSGVKPQPPRDIQLPTNRIYYGPPGTGKTFELSKLLKRDYQKETASASDAEWRNQVIAEKVVGLKWWEAVAAALYDLGGTAKVGQLLDHPFVQAVSQAKGRKQGVRETLWGTLQHHTIETSSTVKTKLRLAPAIFDKTADSVWRFDGDWHEMGGDLIALVDEYRKGPESNEGVQRYSFVTFHQSYGYEEFVEGLRPVLNGESETDDIQYEVRAGIFKALCQRARMAPEQRFAMVIDEINRGNISKIFGELITLIEPDKREGAEHAISVALPYSGEQFSVPPNVDIIGTMNTADRSLALLDTALRRRFDFVPIMPDARDVPDAPLHGLYVTVDDKRIEVPKMLSAVNQRIEALYDRDHTIGHAYFACLAQIPDGQERMERLRQIFRNRIVPLLEEYFFEDWQKIRLVLADNQKAEPGSFIVESQDHEDDLTRLFGSDHGLDAYTTKRHYEVQESAFSNPDAYIGIYQTMSP